MNDKTREQGEHIVMSGHWTVSHSVDVDAVELAADCEMHQIALAAAAADMVADTLCDCLTAADPADCDDMQDLGNGCYRRYAAPSE